MEVLARRSGISLPVPSEERQLHPQRSVHSAINASYSEFDYIEYSLTISKCPYIRRPYCLAAGDVQPTAYQTLNCALGRGQGVTVMACSHTQTRTPTTGTEILPKNGFSSHLRLGSESMSEQCGIYT